MLRPVSELTRDFLAAFQRQTEEIWSRATIDPNVYGFQFQRGTRWFPGLSDVQIADYEAAVDAAFPRDFKTMLGSINGTDMPTLNVYGSKFAPKESVGMYSYPRDLNIVAERISALAPDREGIAAELADQGFTLHADAQLVPIYSHRYVVCGSDRTSGVVLSVEGTDTIVYGDTLRSYLEVEFLRGHAST